MTEQKTSAATASGDDLEASPFASTVVHELNTVEDVADIFGVAPATVRWWIHVGRAPRSFKIAGGRRTYFTRADVISWLEQQHAAGATA